MSTFHGFFEIKYRLEILPKFEYSPNLNEIALQEDIVRIYVTNVLDKKYAVDKSFLEFLEEYINTFIRWKHKYVVYKGRDIVGEVQKDSIVEETCFHLFEWTEEGSIP